MGWNIKKWLGLDNSTDTSQERYEAREAEKKAREAIQDQLAEERRQAAAREQAYAQRTGALTASLQQLQIQQQQQSAQFAQAIQYQQQAAAAAAAQARQQQQALEEQMIRAQERAAAQAAEQARQIALSRAEAADQKRIAGNLSRASVPDAQEGAVTPAQTDGSISGNRKKKNNELSELSIVSDASAISPAAKAGLQIA